VTTTLSLGAGVQSSTLFLMACEGELRIDNAVFADTGFEPSAVYTYLDWLKTQAERAGIPLVTVSYGNIRDNELSTTKQVGAKGKYTLMPLHTVGANGKKAGQKGMLRRQCTSRYKIEPIQKWLRKQGATKYAPVELLLGISWDESQRMTDSRVPIARHVYPLIDRRMTRQDCIDWMTSRGYPEPPKSACIHCPYRRSAGWAKMRDEAPEDFAQAVEFDAAIRNHYTAFDDIPYLHDSRVPLGEADLRSEQDKGQIEMFDSDGCGVLCVSERLA
jgi:hypothetical protein